MAYSDQRGYLQEQTRIMQGLYCKAAPRT
jgi:hypothetical protein